VNIEREEAKMLYRERERDDDDRNNGMRTKDRVGKRNLKNPVNSDTLHIALFKRYFKYPNKVLQVSTI
jgi:hypothetical protein